MINYLENSYKISNYCKSKVERVNKCESREDRWVRETLGGKRLGVSIRRPYPRLYWFKVDWENYTMACVKVGDLNVNSSDNDISYSKPHIKLISGKRFAETIDYSSLRDWIWPVMIFTIGSGTLPWSWHEHWFILANRNVLFFPDLCQKFRKIQCIINLEKTAISYLTRRLYALRKPIFLIISTCEIYLNRFTLRRI